MKQPHNLPSRPRAGILAALAIFIFCAAAALRAEDAPAGSLFTRRVVFRCGCPDCVQPLVETSGPAVAARGVFDSGARPSRWVNNPPTVPAVPDQRTVVTYSIVTGVNPVTHAGEVMEPIVDTNFVGATTIATIQEGVESWNDALGITFRYVSSGGQLVVGAKTFPGGQVGLGGFTSASNDGTNWYLTEGFVQLDQSDGAWTASLLRAVAAHESGHALGLNHTNLNSALLYPSATSVTGPRGDDRWYGQFLYGPAPAKLSASPVQSSGVLLQLGRAAPQQTGAASDPTYQGSAALPNGPGTGTGSNTQNDVLRYVVERQGPADVSFLVLNANVTASSGGQNADAELSHMANQFNFSDSAIGASGTYLYRVKAVRANSGDDIYSDSVSVNVTAGPPVVSDLSVTTNEDIPVSGVLTGGGGGTPVFSIVTPPASGTAAVTNSATGAFTYTPNANVNGTDSFTFKLNNGAQDSNVGTVTVTIVSVNDAPVAVMAPSAPLQTLEGAGVAFDGSGSFDVDGAVVAWHWNFGDGVLDNSGPHVVHAYSTAGLYTVSLFVTDNNSASGAAVSTTVLVAGGARDGALYSAKGAFAVNWKKHNAGENADSFKFSGLLNPRGAAADLTGAQARVLVGGSVLASGLTLLAKGTFASPSGSAPAFKFKFNPAKGAYSFGASKADLSALPGLANADAASTLPLSVSVELTGAGLATPLASGQYDYVFKSTQDASAKGKFAFTKNTTFSGVALSVKTGSAETPAGQKITASGPLVAGGGGPVLPTGALTLHLGGATLVLPALTRTGDSDFQSVYTLPVGAVAGLLKFQINNAKRAFSLATAELPGTGIPAAGAGAPTVYNLPIIMEITTVQGLFTFDTTIELKRKDEFATKWKR